MIDQTAISFKAQLAKQIVFNPDMADVATRQIWGCLSRDIRDVMFAASYYIALLDIGEITYRALVIDFPTYNPLAEVRHLEKLERICSISHQLTGLSHVAAIHRKHGVMAEIAPESEIKYILWSF